LQGHGIMLTWRKTLNVLLMFNSMNYSYEITPVKYLYDVRTIRANDIEN
jgi:hypothetical protein